MSAKAKKQEPSTLPQGRMLGNGVIRFPGVGLMRALSTSVVDTLRRAGRLGVTFGGKRDIFESCGYERYLQLRDYRDRYDRGDIASRVVEAFPESTWRGTGEDCIYDSDDPANVTPFQQAWNDLNKRLKIWSVFCRADILAGLGQYSLVVIGAPGDYATPLPAKFEAKDLGFLMPFAQEDAPIVRYDEDIRSPRYGQPLQYQLRRVSNQRKTNEFSIIPWATALSRPIH